MGYKWFSSYQTLIGYWSSSLSNYKLYFTTETTEFYTEYTKCFKSNYIWDKEFLRAPPCQLRALRGKRKGSNRGNRSNSLNMNFFPVNINNIPLPKVHGVHKKKHEVIKL